MYLANTHSNLSLIRLNDTTSHNLPQSKNSSQEFSIIRSGTSQNGVENLRTAIIKAKTFVAEQQNLFPELIDNSKLNDVWLAAIHAENEYLDKYGDLSIAYSAAIKVIQKKTEIYNKNIRRILTPILEKRDPRLTNSRKYSFELLNKVLEHFKETGEILDIDELKAEMQTQTNIAKERIKNRRKNFKPGDRH